MPIISASILVRDIFSFYSSSSRPYFDDDSADSSNGPDVNHGSTDLVYIGKDLWKLKAE
jgi:hypothetical protein